MNTALLTLGLLVILAACGANSEAPMRTSSVAPPAATGTVPQSTPTSSPVPSPTPAATPVPRQIPTPTFNELRNQALTLSYDDLFRNNEQHKSKVVTYLGRVAQVQEVGKDKYLLRVNVTQKLGSFWQDDVRVDYSGPRILEDDIVEFVGSVEGLWTYKAVLGNERTVPHIRAIQLVVPAIAPTPTAIPTSAPLVTPSSTASLQPTPSPLPLTPTPAPMLTPAHTDLATPLPTTASLPSGVVSWWPGDGNANDIVDGNNGALTGGTTFAPGKVGQAFSLDGIDDLVNLGNAPNLRISVGDYTVAAWVRFNALQGDMSIVDKMSSSGVANSDGWRLLKQADNYFWFCSGGVYTNGCDHDSSTTVRSSTGARVGVWFHVAAVKSSNTISIYVNGVLENIKVLTTFTDTHSAYLLIGSNAREGAHLNGLVDEVKIFNRALTVAEIKTIYEADSGR